VTVGSGLEAVPGQEVTVAVGSKLEVVPGQEVTVGLTKTCAWKAGVGTRGKGRPRRRP